MRACFTERVSTNLISIQSGLRRFGSVMIVLTKDTVHKAETPASESISNLLEPMAILVHNPRKVSAAASRQGICNIPSGVV